MQHSVKGLTFTEQELSSVKLAELKVDSVSQAHLFTFVKERPFLLLRAGDYIDSEFIEKYQARGVVSFRCLETASADHIALWKRFFTRIKACRSERERLLLRDEFILAFGDHYWRQSDKSFLGFARACFDEFYNLPVHIVQNLQATSHVLYSRSLLTSSISVVNCLIESIVDFEFIRDMYNAAFMMDYGFVGQGDFSYLLVQACESERNRPGSGLLFLERHPKAKSERAAFFSHPALSAKLALECESSFHFPEVIEHIRYHHEKADGSGFPAGFSYSAIAQSETILMFADHMAPFEERIFKSGDGVEIIKDAFVALNSLEDKELLPINRALEAWERSMDWVKSEVAADNSEKEAS